MYSRPTVWFSVPAEGMNFPPLCADRTTTVENIHPTLRLYDRCGLDCVRFLGRRVTVEDLRVVHVCTSSFDDEGLFVEFPRRVLCLIFLTLDPTSA